MVAVRAALLRLHRWVGLTIAAFLFVSGLTGAIISWDHELDEWLNPHLTRAATVGDPLPALELAARFEAREPDAQVVYLPLQAEPGEALAMFVQPRVDPGTGRLRALDYNQVFLDPVTGNELGRREWGQVWPISTETVVSFLYKLHYSLHIPPFWGTDRWGYWFLGGVAILWTIDCFVGFYLTLPPRRAPVLKGTAGGRQEQTPRFWKRWRPAWMIKTSGSVWRINFDLHRAFGLWTWALLFVLAFTGFSLNLYREVFLPVISTVSKLTPTPFMERAPTDPARPVVPRLDMAHILPLARAEASRRAWSTPPGSIFYAGQFGIYAVQFFAVGDEHGAAGVGPAALYFDAQDGRVLGDRRPWHGTAADIFVQAQFPLHSGRILGLPGRILISAMGLVVAGLSVTGVIIWWRKRRARSVSLQRRAALSSFRPAE